MRYVGQSYELTVPLPAERLDASKIDRVLEQFHIEHDRAYGYSAPTEPVEFVNLRLTAIGQNRQASAARIRRRQHRHRCSAENYPIRIFCRK